MSELKTPEFWNRHFDRPTDDVMKINSTPERFFRQQSLSEPRQSSSDTNISSDTDSGFQHLEGIQQKDSNSVSDSHEFILKERGSEEEIFYSTEETLQEGKDGKLSGSDEKICGLRSKWLKNVDPETLDIIQVIFVYFKYV